MAGLFEVSSNPSTQAAQIAVGGNLLGAGVTQAGNMLNTAYSAKKAKELYDYQTDYSKLMQRMVAAGISPAAAAQGLSGATPSMVTPSVPSAPDLSGLGSAGVTASAIPSQINSNIQEAEYKRQSAEELRQKMEWNPKLWSQQVRESESRWQNNVAQSKYYDSLKKYYDEYATNLVAFRPWELEKLKKSLLVMDSEISKNYSFGRQADSHAFLMNHQVFEQMWRNQLLSAGVNPSQSIWENIKRISIMDPAKGKVFLDNAIELVNMLDEKASENLGEHYKRNALILGGLHYANNRIGQHRLLKSQRFKNNMRGVASLMGVAGSLLSAGAGSAMAPVPSSLMDDSWYDYYDYFH